MWYIPGVHTNDYPRKGVTESIAKHSVLSVTPHLTDIG